MLTDALYVLQESEGMRAQDKQAAKRGEVEEPAKGTQDILPIVQWLQETAKPRMGQCNADEFEGARSELAADITTGHLRVTDKP
jgi:hypothetical protein